MIAMTAGDPSHRFRAFVHRARVARALQLASDLWLRSGWGVTLATVTLLASFGGALATSSWYSSSAARPGGDLIYEHIADPNLWAIAAAAVAITGILAFPGRRLLLVMALWGAALLATQEALDDGWQWFAPVGYGVAGVGVLTQRQAPWWSHWSKSLRLGLTAGIGTVGGFLIMARIGVEGSEWDARALTFWLGVGALLAMWMVGSAWLANQRRHRWLLVMVALLTTLFAYFTSLTVGFLFYPVVILLWVTTVRSFRRRSLAAI